MGSYDNVYAGGETLTLKGRMQAFGIRQSKEEVSYLPAMELHV